jgi:hypothetical protein
MNWYYASDGQQGPVDQSALDNLIQQGVVTPSTLVWREGMTTWQPYGEAMAPAIITAPPIVDSAGAMLCSECGKAFAPDQLVRIGNGLVCAVCKPVALQKLREGVVDNELQQIRKAHISHEASVKSVGLLYLLGAALMLLGCLGVIFTPGGDGFFVGLFAALFGVAQLWLGIGLRRLKPWARIGSGILSGLGLLAIPIGTIINAYILYLLFSKKGATVFSEDYQRVVAATPEIKYRTSIVIWIAVALLLVLIGFGLMVAYFAPLSRPR